MKPILFHVEAGGIEMIWGEATASSAPFYTKILQSDPIQDLFVIRGDTMRSIRDYYETDRKRRLAKLEP